MSNMRCFHCKLVNYATAATCRRCGSEMAYADHLQPDQAAHHWQPTNVTPESVYGASSFSAQQPNWQGNAPMNQPYYMPAQSYVPQQLKQGLAIASLICGLLGCVTSIPGMICGIMAIKKANKYPAEYGGKGLAIAGVVISSLSLLTIPIIAAIAIPNLLAARQAANEASAIKTLRMLAGAEATFQATSGRGEYGSLEQLQAAGLISADLKLNNKSGYHFSIVTVGATSQTPAHFEIHAMPLSQGSSGTGVRSFYMDETFVIYGADRKGAPADRRARPIE